MTIPGQPGALLRAAGLFALLSIFAHSGLAQNPSKSTEPRPDQFRITLHPCEIPSLKETARCGKLDVYEDRDSKTGRKIALNILVLPALSPAPKPDPIFYFEGGPGGSAVTSAKASPFGKLFKAWRAERDIVFVDQRGTGESNPLRCDLADPDDMTQYFSDQSAISRIGKISECRDRLSKTSNLALYTTPIAMDDLDDVRQALGYDKINLFGGSYGTRAALVYIRQHGDHVRSAVLDGVAPTNYKLPLPFSKGVQNALDRLFADCAADEKCREKFPDVKADLEAALAHLDKGPVTATGFNTIKKQPQEVTMTRGAFMDVIRLMLYDPQAASLVPLVLHQAALGEFGGAATLGFIAEYQLRSFAGGMGLSVVCAEDIPFITDADIKRATEGTYYGDSRARAMVAACREWPRGKLPANYSDPVRSDVPVLIISGDVDPVTPPWLAADAARSLSHSRQIVGKNWSHSSISDCGNNLIADFISRGTAEGLDAACMQNGIRPPFNTGEVAFAPKEHPAGTVKASYEGILDVGAQKLRLVLNLFKAPDGTYSASLDSPDQGAEGLAVDVITVKDGGVHFEMKQIGVTYNGKLNPDASLIDGEFKQGGLDVSLQLKKKN